MTFPTPACIADTSAWPKRDPSWQAERKRAWRELQAAVDALLLGAAERKLLQKYFLTGESRNPTPWERHPYPSLPLFARLWMHPDASATNWQRQIAATAWPDYQVSLRMLRVVCGDNGPGVGGLEPRMYEVFMAEPYTRSFLDLDAYDRGKTQRTQRPIGRPDVESVIYELNLVLELSDKYPLCLARYAFRSCLNMPDDEGWLRMQDDEQQRSHGARFFDLVRFRASAQGAAVSTEGQIELAHELMAQLDQGGGPPAFQALWRKHARSTGWQRIVLRGGKRRGTGRRAGAARRVRAK